MKFNKLFIIIGIVILAIMALVPTMSVGAQDNATATPTPSGWQSGYVNQGAPGLATPPPSAIIVVSATPNPGFDSSLPQDYAAQNAMFGVSVYGEPNQDGWSWTNWDWLVVTLNQTVTNVVAFIDDWNNDNNDGYVTISGNAGDQFALSCSGSPCQIDFSYQPTPEPTDVPPTTTPVPPTGHWCKLCNTVVTPPQTYDCYVPLGGTAIVVKDGNQKIAFTQMPWGLRFNDGDRMNAKPQIYVKLSTGEELVLQMRPGESYGMDRKYCFILTSSFHPEGFASGHLVQVSKANGAGDPHCVWVFVPDVVAPAEQQ